MSLQKGELHLTVGAHDMPLKVLITQGTTADCTPAITLIDELSAGFLLADHEYDSDAIIALATLQGMSPVIPPKKNREQRRGIATRYAKNATSFLALSYIVQSETIHDVFLGSCFAR